MKTCKICKEDKLDEEMCQIKGQTMYCIPCKRQYEKDYYEKHKEKIREKAKETYARRNNKPKKICSRCKELKYINEYHKETKMIDGLSTRCKKCIHEIYLNRKNPGFINKNESRNDKTECNVCDVKFDDGNKCWAKGMCKKCYYKMLYVIHPKPKYDKGRWSRRIEAENHLENIQLRKSNKTRLKMFINDVNRKSGYIDMVDSFIMADLFEIYSDGNKYDLDALPVERQLIRMWEYLKEL